MGKSQSDPVRERCAEQDSNEYGSGIAVRHGHEAVKTPAKKVAQSNRYSQINQSEHCRESIADSQTKPNRTILTDLRRHRLPDSRPCLGRRASGLLKPRLMVL